MDYKHTLNETLIARFEGEQDEVMDLVEPGIMGGFSGFIYTCELNEFYREFEDELETYYWDMFGSEWLTHLTDNCSSMDEVRARMVWGYVEGWCQDRLTDLEEEQEEGYVDSLLSTGLCAKIPYN